MDERFGIIADDLTGAGDTAVQFAGLGLPSLVVFGDLALPEGTRAVAVDSDSRRLSDAEAGAAAGAGAELSRRLGATRFYKKVDSVLRGHLGPELDAVMDAVGARAALVAPAFPANGRLTAGGYHLVRGVPVAETETALDPVTPVTESHLPTLLTETSRRRVGHLPLRLYMGGLPAVRAEVDRLSAVGATVVVCDATTDRHLELLAELLWEDRSLLGCGAAGLGRALAVRFATAVGAVAGANEPDRAATHRPVLVLAGSRSKVTVAQVEAFAATGAVLMPVEPEELLSARAPGALAEVAARAARELAAGRSVAIHLSFTTPVRTELSHLLAAALGEIGAAALAAAPATAGLVLTGGDTARAVCRALGAQAIAVKREFCPAVPLGTLVGGSFPGLGVVPKSGGFGDPGALAAAASALAALG
ncbi:MAG: four-carbon acid sugar kinase family protein, partial [Chitinophagales bacterium]